MIPHRPLFWSIPDAGLFYALATVAMATFAYGAASGVLLWVRGSGARCVRLTRSGLSRFLLDGLAGRRIFRGDVAAGAMHTLVLWGFLGLLAGTVLTAADHRLSFLNGRTYLIYSMLVDLAGVMFVVGLVWALIRRYVQRVPRLERRVVDLAVVALLLAVALSGFLVEGVRLAVERPAWAAWSFAGLTVSLVLPDSSGTIGMYRLAWWIHAILSLGLVAAIPFTRLFHLLAAPASVSLADGARVPLDACTRCGRCVEVCPSSAAGEPFSPRTFVVGERERLWREHRRTGPLRRLTARVGIGRVDAHPAEAPGTWHCTACGACLDACPVYVAPPEVVRGVRGRTLEEGTTVPAHLTEVLERLYKYDNPWQASRKKRGAWSRDLDVPDLTQEGQDGKDAICYFVGCTTALDTRAQRLAHSFARILGHAGVPFGTLGKAEPCCGSIARDVGEAGLFEDQMEQALALFGRHGIRSIVTSSPHCFDAFRSQAPAFEAAGPVERVVGVRARHYVEVLDELVRDGSLRFETPLRSRVTYHDSCYLGRHNGIYDTPRRVIASIPGVELVEMEHHASHGLCCGGGGGRMWQQDLDGDVKMSEIRIREAQATGAEIVVTACPLCLIMLDDARKTAGLESSLQVLDLNELAVMGLAPSGGGDVAAPRGMDGFGGRREA